MSVRKARSKEASKLVVKIVTTKSTVVGISESKMRVSIKLFNYLKTKFVLNSLGLIDNDFIFVGFLKSPKRNEADLIHNVSCIL